MCFQNPAKKYKSWEPRSDSKSHVLLTSFVFISMFCFCFFYLCDSCAFSQIVDNPAEVADKADRIITMLPSSPNVVDVYTGPNGILK